MTTFGLVHGAGTVGASWAPVALLLANHGHRVVAPDLPMEDAAATFDDYAQAVLDALGDAEDVVLAGHSMGGMVLPLVAARRPVRAAAYVAALVPQPGESLGAQMRAEPMFTPEMADALARGDDGLLHWREAAARELLLDGVAPERAEQALASLRGHATAPYKPPFPDGPLPAVPSTYVVCAHDRVVSPQWGRDTGAARLGATVVELDAGHMPMLTHPRELAAILEGLA